MLIKAMIISAILTLPPPPMDAPWARLPHYSAVVGERRKDTPKKTRQRIDRWQVAASGKQISLPGTQGSAHDFGSCKLHPAPATLAGQDRGKHHLIKKARRMAGPFMETP